MDPNENLQEQRKLAAAIIALADSHEANRARKQLILSVRLAELVEALDEWLSKGGHLPAPWHAEGKGRRTPND